VQRKILFFRFIILISITNISLFSDSLKESENLSSKTNSTLQKSQKKIDKLDDEQRMMMAKYEVASQELENYNIYNKQLQDIIDSQNSELELLQKQIGEIDDTKLKIIPLMIRMIDTLENFVKKDRPFLPNERAKRIKNLRKSMKRADISIAEKYRLILEAYQVEIDYGNTIEAYSGEIEKKRVNFLKVGRVALFYQTLDKKETAVWETKTGSWKKLNETSYHMAVAKGIKIARKQRTPDLLFIAVDQAKDRK
jgi:hypothetical protein